MGRATPTREVPELTGAEAAVLDALIAYIQDRGYPPTVRDLARASGRSVATVSRHVAVLVAKSYCKARKNEARGLRVVRNSKGESVTLSFKRSRA